MESNSNLQKDQLNTIMCNSLSDCYTILNDYILEKGWMRNSRIGKTYELLNFKTIIEQPTYRCLIAYKRNVNIFFHLAEFLWVFTGRNDLEFISFFNSNFHNFTDNGKTLHGAYGNRIRFWHKSNDTIIDQLLENCILLDKDKESRRAVISLWNPSLDLNIESNDIPCNTQIAFKVQEEDLHITIFNRSNDLHLGYVANVFQFSFLGEIIALLINKKLSTQTHISQSLHVYDENAFIAIKQSDIHNEFYERYKPSCFQFLFEKKDIADRLIDIDEQFNLIIKIVIEKGKNDLEVEEIYKIITPFKIKSQSIFEIAFLLLLYLSYKKKIKSGSNINEIRASYAKHILSHLVTQEVNHQDYFALALNYFVNRIPDFDLKSEFFKFDPNIGNY